MTLLDQIATDAAAIASDMSSGFAKSHLVDGASVPCILHVRAQDPDPGLDQFQMQPSRARTAVLILSQSLIGRPSPGAEIDIDGDVWQIMRVSALAVGQVRLVLSRWEG